MRIYLAGSENTAQAKILKEVGAESVLLSYFYLQGKRQDFGEFITEYFPKANIFLDCGAYTAWTMKKEISVKEYGEFGKKYEKFIDVYPNLDVKGDPQKTDQNQKTLEDMGLKPIPVYHMDRKDWKVFEEMCKKYDYIALGAIAGEKSDQVEIIKELRNAVNIANKYKTKLHAFGVTSFDVLWNTKVFSADSTTWLEGAKNATIYIPDFKYHRFDMFSRKDKNLFKYKDYFKERGIEYDKVISPEGSEDRLKVNAGSFMEVEKYLNSKIQSSESAEQSSESEGDIDVKDQTTEMVLQDYEPKRKLNAALANIGNTHNWKHGKFSRYKPSPKWLFDVLDYIDQNDLDEDQAKEHIANLIKMNLKRVQISQLFEQLDGGVQDPKLTTMIRDTIMQLFLFQGKMILPTGDFTQNLTQVNIGGEVAKELGQLEPKQRDQVIDSLRRIIGKGE